jgi:hypothetical protein
MFYGRVDVYWPDGPVESYRLNKPTIAVGRSPGNDIVLDTTAISRYHITLVFRDQQAFLEDLGSVNGTYVDGLRLEANAPRGLRGGEEVQIGDVRLIFHPPIEEGATVPGEADTTQRVVLSKPTYQIELEGPDLAVSPGAHAQAVLKIDNLGETTDSYFVEVDGLPKGWVRVDHVETELEPGEQGQILISLKPLRRSESQPGEHTFTVRVRAQSRPAETLDIPSVIHVLPYSGFGMALGNTRIESSAGFKLYLHNQGNAPLRLTIQGTDSDHSLRFQLPAAQIQLAPGERQTLIGTITPRRRRLFGQVREHEFALLAHAHDASGFVASIPGTYVEKSLMPSWVPVVVVPLAGLTLVIVAALLVLLFNNNNGGKKTPAVQPSILNFTASSPSISLGESVQVTWEVTDAQEVALYIDHGDTRQTYPATSSPVPPVTLPFDQTGLYTLVLEAHNGDLVSTAAVTVEVRPLVTMSVQAVGASQLVYNVRQLIQLTWNVSGAREFDGAYNIWFSSPNQPDPLLVAPQPLAGQTQVEIVPQEGQAEWLVTLYAQGQDDVAASMTQTLPIVYPSCELSVARTVVRSGPAEAYPAIVPPLESSAAGNLSLSPVARDPSGAWLQIMIGVDNPRPGWVVRNDLACANFDPDQLVITQDFPPLPVPTPAATATSTPTLSPTVSPANTPAVVPTTPPSP